MNTIKKYLGVVLVILGAVCLVVYKFAMPENSLLVSAIALELVGIASHVFLNK